MSQPNHSHRFAPNKPPAQLWISSILCLIYCALVLIVRLHIKWNLYGADDTAISLATILQSCGNIPLFIALKNGLGLPIQDLAEQQVLTIGKATFTAQLFFIVTLATSKLSVAALMLRLFTADILVTRRARLFCYATIAVTLLWAAGALISTGIICSPPSFVQQSTASRCSMRLDQWKIITAFDILTELLLVTLPVLFVWPIQMKRYIKLQVAVAFSFRLPIVAIAAVHLHYVLKYNSGPDTTQAIIPALVLQQCEVFWSLISATIPTLKAFMRTFNSGFGMDIDAYSPYGHNSARQNSKTYILESVRRASDRETITVPEIYAHGTVQGVKVGASREITTDPTETHTRPVSTLTSDSSREILVTREVAWRISYEAQGVQES